jgi:hypothetical protein
VTKPLTALLAFSSIASSQQVDYATQVRNKPMVDAREFDWFRTNGVGASGDLSASGAGR